MIMKYKASVKNKTIFLVTVQRESKLIVWRFNKRHHKNTGTVGYFDEFNSAKEWLLGCLFYDIKVKANILKNERFEYKQVNDLEVSHVRKENR